MPRVGSSLLMLIGAVVGTGLANAADGVLEINQACAVQTGCFSGDAAGFPVEITASAPGRSFRLTGDLDNSNTAGSTIAITTSGVSVDLGGFSVRGPAACSLGGFGVTCSNTGAGVLIDGGTAARVHLHGGRVTGSPSAGILLGGLANVRDVTVWSAGSDGITVGPGSRIEDCTVADVLGNGIRANQSWVGDTMIFEPRLSAVVNADATYLTALRNVETFRWGIPAGNPPFVNTLSIGTNMCNSVAC